MPRYVPLEPGTDPTAQSNPYPRGGVGRLVLFLLAVFFASALCAAYFYF